MSLVASGGPTPRVGGHGHHGHSFSHTMEENPRVAKARSPGEGWARHPPKGQGPRKEPTSTTPRLCMATTCPLAAGGDFGDTSRLGDTPSRPRFHPSKTFLTGGKRSACPCWDFLSRRAESKTGGIKTKKKKELNQPRKPSAGGTWPWRRRCARSRTHLEQVTAHGNPRGAQTSARRYGIAACGVGRGKGPGDVGWRHGSSGGLGSPRGGSYGGD